MWIKCIAQKRLKRFLNRLTPQKLKIKLNKKGHLKNREGKMFLESDLMEVKDTLARAKKKLEDLRRRL